MENAYISNKCPNGGKMVCQYSEERRKSIAQYYRDITKGKVMSVQSEASADASGTKHKTKFTINGKEVENPLQECFDSGECVILGYGPPLPTLKEAVPALIQALGDKDKRIRREAANALKEIGTPEAIKAVEEYEKRQ